MTYCLPSVTSECRLCQYSNFFLMCPIFLSTYAVKMHPTLIYKASGHQFLHIFYRNVRAVCSGSGRVYIVEGFCFLFYIFGFSRLHSCNSFVHLVHDRAMLHQLLLLPEIRFGAHAHICKAVFIRRCAVHRGFHWEDSPMETSVMYS